MDVTADRPVVVARPHFSQRTREIGHLGSKADCWAGDWSLWADSIFLGDTAAFGMIKLVIIPSLGRLNDGAGETA